MKFRVLFTLDYEIHGNGHGSPWKLMVEPTERMLKQFDQFGARLTVMADVAEILRFERHFRETGRDDFASEAIREQLRTAVRTGHDVQLHLHPSYYNSQFVDHHFAQDYSEYDLARLPPERLASMVRESKQWLESLLAPVKNGYSCAAFRAANWSMNPPQAILKALVESGIFIDTSVFKYGKRDGMVCFDYSDAHSDLVPWPVDRDDVCRRDPQGRVFEFPIYSESRPVWQFLTPNRVYRVLQSTFNPLPKDEFAPTVVDNSPNRNRMRGLVGRLREILLARHAWKLDFNQCSGTQLVEAARRIRDRYARSKTDLPVVLIGHSKTFTSMNQRSLEPFLRFVADNRDTFAFGTFRDFNLAQFVD